MAVSKVVVVDGNNLIVRIDRGVAGRGVTDVEPVEIDGSLYLVFTFSDGTTETVGPVGTIQYIGQSPIVVSGSTISLTTVPIAKGGTGQITANAGFNALAPTQTGNTGKYLKTDGTNSAWDLLDISTADITGTLPIVNGGTGQTTANTGFNALAPAQATNAGKYLKTDGTNSSWDLLDISTADITGVLPIANGGTNASTASGARTNLGLGTIATQDASSVAITGGSITGITDLAVADGGTGASTASGARTNLNAADQATTLTAGTGLSGGGDLSANRTFSITNTGVAAAAYGAASKTLTATVNAQGQLTVLADTPIAIANTQISGLGTMSTQNANAVAITGGSITGITDLAVADGGTGASTAAGAMVNLLPSYTGNANKRLSLDGTATGLEWVTDGGGTVTSIDVSGGTTGLSFTGGPVTTSGTITLSGTLDLDNGGTGATTAAGARTNLNAADQATTLTAGTGLSGGGDLSANRTFSITNTSVTAASYGSASNTLTATVNAQGQLTAMAATPIAIANTQISGLGTMSTQNANSVAITGGSITGITDLAVADGGTGASDAAGARTNLNAANQATTITAGTGLSGGGDLSANRTIDIANTTVTAGAFGSASNTLTATVNAQGQLTALAATPIAIANTQVSGLGTMSTQNSNAVTITGGSITGITDLAIADGGTGASNATDARSNLGLGSAAVLNAGVALGVATLDAGGTVPLSQIPASIQGGVSYQGAWNASTNTPTLVSSVGSKGFYYVVSVAGNTNLNGVTDWLVGDWAIYNGTAWEKIDNTDQVASVNGYTGVVVLSNTDVGAPPTSLTISAGTGLSGGGSLAANRTISIANTTVTAAPYGTASAVPTFTVNGQGQLTAASDVTIAIANTQVSGLGTMSTQNANSVAITGGSITGITDLAIADGGTGASTAPDARTNLGLGTIATQDASSVAITGGAINGTTIGATTPSTVTGTTITANTRFVGTNFDASGSGGGALRTSSSANVLQWGGGGGVNLTLDGAFNMNPANASISIAPTGTGTLTINPATAGTINNMAIGGTTPSSGAFTTVTASTAIGIASGGTGQTTANAAFNALAPSQTGNSGKYLTTDGMDTSWASNPLGTVTSVGGTGTVSGISLSGTVTTSGNLTLGGALDLSAYNGAGAFTTLSSSGNTTLGDAPADNITINGTITSNLIFTDNIYDIGALGATRPRNVYLSGTILTVNNSSSVTQTLQSTGGSVSLVLDANTSGGAFSPQIFFNSNNVGKWALGGGNIGAGGPSDFSLYDYTNAKNIFYVYAANGNMLLNTNLLFADNTYDIGQSGTNRPRNLYLAGTATIGSTVTLSGGTANGVTYLNGSKQLVSGSALTFDGTNLGVTGTVTGATGVFGNGITVMNNVDSTIMLRVGVGVNAALNAGEGLEFSFTAPTAKILSYNRATSAYKNIFIDALTQSFGISGTTALTLNSTSLYTASGINVGLGLNNPSARLHVTAAGQSGPDASNLVLVLEDKTGSLGDNKFAFSTRVTPNSLAIQDLVANATRFIINSSGNVGIGTSTPTAAQLVIKGDGATSQIRLQAATNTNQGLSFIYNYSSQYGQINCDEAGVNQLDLWYTALSHKFGRNTSSASMILDPSGNLVVGASSANAKFEVSVAGTASYSPSSAPTATVLVSTSGVANSRYTSIGIGSRGTSGQSQTNYITNVPEATDGNAALAFSTYGSYAAAERVRITSTGNVGIGITTPNEKLAVYANRNDRMSYFYNQSTNAAASGLFIEVGADNGATKAAWDSGYALTLSNPSYLLSGIVSKLVLNTANGGYNNGAIIHVEGAGGYNLGQLVFSTGWDASSNATERMRINASGNVGIKNNNPLKTLSVTGVPDIRNGGFAFTTVDKEVDSATGYADFSYSETFGGITDNATVLIVVSVYQPTTTTTGEAAGYVGMRFVPRGSNGTLTQISSTQGGGISTFTVSANGDGLRIATDTSPLLRCRIVVLGGGGTAVYSE